MQDTAGFPAAVRWSGALAIVLALHGMVAWVLLTHAIPPMLIPAAPEAVMLDLAPDLPPVQPATIVPPEPAAPPPPPPVPVPVPPPPAPPVPETPPEPPIPIAEPPPVELPPPPPVNAEVVLPIPPPPPPRPQPKPKPRPVERTIQRTPAPPVVDETPRPLAPAPAAPAQQAARPPAPASSATPSWRNELLARLQRAKRYPDLARSRGEQGIASVTFTMDRSGRVVSVGLVRSSGSSLLDDEAVALVRRAEPLPSMPDEMPGGTITLTVPISFGLR